jgi:large subunit ribosomal protein L15e
MKRERMNKHLAVIWKKPKSSLGQVYKDKLTDFRTQATITRIEKPTRLDRARSLGYKAKQGFVVARVKVPRGRRKRPKMAGGRRPKAFGRFFTLGKSKKQVAEEKVSRKFPNLEVLNSYWVGEDGTHKWYEVILVDRSHPVVKKDRHVIKAASKRGRASRGLTSAGKKSRGLR